MPFPLTNSLPSILRSGNGIFLELASSFQLQLPEDTRADCWEQLTIIRGSGLSVRFKLRWNGKPIQNDRFVEVFGRVISRSKLWSQLHLSASLEIPDRLTTEEDIILNMIRTDVSHPPWSPGAVEGLVATHMPTAAFTQLSLSLFFSTVSNLALIQPSTKAACSIKSTGIDLSEKGDVENDISVFDLLSLIDSAFTALVNKNLSQIAPCLFMPGYLEV
ncbi:hypothetical protein BDZ91DRAFT_284790 [Kalaharituber pfeilii]|nr:hypothetical protein BDZ91DRAFT_284790 [Kalaharituber pfeilii]